MDVSQADLIVHILYPLKFKPLAKRKKRRFMLFFLNPPLKSNKKTLVLHYQHLRARESFAHVL